MAELADLEARIRLLEEECRRLKDIEAIRKLKARYWRCNDKKLWDELVDCFVEDAVADYGPGMRFEGAKAIAQHCERGTGGESLITIHQGHNPEIEITGGDTAKGVWELYFFMIDERENSRFRMGGFYYDEYVKVGGEWKIKLLLYTTAFLDAWTLDGER